MQDLLHTKQLSKFSWVTMVYAVLIAVFTFINDVYMTAVSFIDATFSISEFLKVGIFGYHVISFATIILVFGTNIAMGKKEKVTLKVIGLLCSLIVIALCLYIFPVSIFDPVSHLFWWLPILLLAIQIVNISQNHITKHED